MDFRTYVVFGFCRVFGKIKAEIDAFSKKQAEIKAFEDYSFDKIFIVTLKE